MADSYSVKARLSAEDSGFTSTLKKALGTTESLASKLKSGFSFGILTGAGQAAFGALKNGVTGLIGEINNSNAAWKTFAGNMKIIGKSESEINSVKKSLQDFAGQTVYGASDMAQTYAQLAAVGVKDTDKLVKAFGGLAAASENPQQAMKTLSQQATQMAAKPNVAWADFKLMLEQTPAGIAAVAKEMGMSTSQMVTAVQDGKISTDKFFEAIQKAGGAGTEFEKLATTPKTVSQAMDGLTESLSNKLTPAFDVLSSKAIGAIEGISSKLTGLDAEGLASKISSTLDKLGLYWDAFKESFKGVGGEFREAFSAITKGLLDVTGAFGSTESVDSFKSTMQDLANFLKSVANFATEHAGAISTLIKWLPAIVVGIKGFQVAKTVAPFVTTFATGIGKLAKGAVGGIASKLFGISKSQTTVGTTSATSGAQMLTAAKSYALMGVAVLTIAAGFALLAFSAISLANAGGGAIAVMGGLVVALVGLGIGMGALLKSLAPMSAQLMPVALSFLAMGAAVLLISAGFALLAHASIALASAGWGAIAVMVGMIAVIAGLAIGAAVLGTALTAGAVGFIAFGGAIALVGLGFTLIGVGALLAASALTIICGILPQITAYGLQGAVSIAALGAALAVFAVGAGLAGAACLILGAGLLMAGAGMLVFGVGALIAAAAINLLALAFPALIQYGSQSALMLAMLGGTLLVFGAGALVAGAGAIVLGAGLLVATAGVAAFGAAMLISAAGMLVFAAALLAVTAEMKSIAKNAKAAEKSLNSMQSSVDVVESGLKAIGNTAKAALKSLTSAFDSSASKVKSSGKKVAKGFNDGFKGGLKEAPTIAKAATAQVATALMSGQASAFAAGAFISQGFARGMLSQLAVIQSAAAQMAAAADKAVRAKAKIHSPSKVSTQLGNYWGMGYVGGLDSAINDVWQKAKELVSIPTIQTPNLAMAYSGELSSDYSYTRNAAYSITVVSEIDGREVAKSTANYTEEELNKREARNNRKRGEI